MNKIILAAVASIAFSPIAAFAQVQQTSESDGHSNATAVVENGGDGSGNGYYGAHGNNVDAVAPTIYSNNTCAMAAAGSASFLGIGIGGGFNHLDRRCDDRANEIVMLTAAQRFQNPKLARWAINIMCKDNADTAPAGMCPSSQPAAAVAPRAVSYVAQPVQQPVTPSPSPQPTRRPDWCGTWSRGDGPMPASCD